MTRRKFAALLMASAAPAPALFTSRSIRAAELIPVTLYKNPSCTCCEAYAQYLEQNGFKVDVKPTNDLAEISRKAGTPPELEGCHTSFEDLLEFFRDERHLAAAAEHRADHTGQRHHPRVVFEVLRVDEHLEGAADAAVITVFPAERLGEHAGWRDRRLMVLLAHVLLATKRQEDCPCFCFLPCVFAHSVLPALTGCAVYLRASHRRANPSQCSIDASSRLYWSVCKNAAMFSSRKQGARSCSSSPDGGMPCETSVSA